MATAATVKINEYNTDTENETADINNSNMGSVDSANLNPIDNPVVPGENTYEKWQKIWVELMGDSSKIDNLKVWRTGALGGAATHETNATENSTDYSIASFPAEGPGTGDSGDAIYTMPTSEPDNANLGIGGDLAGDITTDDSYSDYLVHQIQTHADDTEGSTTTLNYQYDETA